MAALLGHDFVEPKLLNELHQILLLWNRNFSQPLTRSASSKRKQTKKHSTARKSCFSKKHLREELTDSNNESLRIILHHSRTNRPTQSSFVETSQETLKVFGHLMVLTFLDRIEIDASGASASWREPSE